MHRYRIQRACNTMDYISIAFVYYILLQFVAVNITCTPQRQPILTENDILKLSLRTHAHVNKRMFTSIVNTNNNNNNNRSSSTNNNRNNIVRVSIPSIPHTYAHNKSMKEKIKAIFDKVDFSFKSSRLRGRQNAKGMLPSCRCKWPDLSQDGAEPQPCPPPNIKCEICMSSVNALRYGSNPVNYCAGSFDMDLYSENQDDTSMQTYQEFCQHAGAEMSGVTMEIYHVIKELTKSFGEGFGASHEICTNMGCCDEKPTHTDLPPFEAGAISNKASGRDPVSGGQGGGNDNMYHNVEGVKEAKGADMNTNGGTHQGPGTGSRKDTYSGKSNAGGGKNSGASANGAPKKEAPKKEAPTQEDPNLAKEGSSNGKVKYNNGGKRNKPIQKELMRILEKGASAAKVDVSITSGGQVRKADGGRNGVDRTGSNRHDNGWAADIALYNKGKILSSARKDDLPLMITFMKACKSAGATAIGQGNGYMSNTGIHVDIALKGQSKGNIDGISQAKCWGGKKSRFAGSPQYLKDIMRL
jgi:hypothetical protein